MSAFFGHNIAGGGGVGFGGGGGGGPQHDEPKAHQKNCHEEQSYITITWKGFFFTQSQVLLSSIVGHHLCTRIWVSTMIGMLKKAIV